MRYIIFIFATRIGPCYEYLFIIEIIPISSEDVERSSLAIRSFSNYTEYFSGGRRPNASLHYTSEWILRLLYHLAFFIRERKYKYSNNNDNKRYQIFLAQQGKGREGGPISRSTHSYNEVKRSVFNLSLNAQYRQFLIT